MIKNSTLIGRAVPAPVGWKRFKVGELFDVIMPSSGSLEEVIKRSDEPSQPTGYYPGITSTTANNGRGVWAKVNQPNVVCSRKLTIAANGDCGTTFYQANDFVLVRDCYGLDLKNAQYRSDERVLLYFAALLNKLLVPRYSYNYKARWHNRVALDKFELPINAAGQPDFDWIVRYMDAVGQQTLARRELANAEQIKAYLTESGQDSYKDTVSDREFMQLWRNLPTKTFKLSELFDVTRGSRLTVANRRPGKIPLVTAGKENWGISDYISNPNQFSFAGNCITIDMFGNVFYRDYIFKADDNILVSYGKSCQDKAFMLFASACLTKKLAGRFTYGKQYRLMGWKTSAIALPIMNDHIATAEITHFMKLQARPLVDSTTACMIGRVRINLSAITYFMSIQTKRMIVAKKQQLDRELELMKQV